MVINRIRPCATLRAGWICFRLFGGSKPPPYDPPQIASHFGRGGARSVTERVLPPYEREVARESVTEGARVRKIHGFVPLFSRTLPHAAPATAVAPPRQPPLGGSQGQFLSARKKTRREQAPALRFAICKTGCNAEYL